VTVAMRTYVAKGEEAEALKVGRIGSWWMRRTRCWAAWQRALARALIGKDNPSFILIWTLADHVVVINADKIRMTGNKLEQKVYYSHSGYPGGLKEVPAKRVREAKPEWMVREAIHRYAAKEQAARAAIEEIARLSRCGRSFAAHRTKPKPLAVVRERVQSTTWSKLGTHVL